MLSFLLTVSEPSDRDKLRTIFKTHHVAMLKTARSLCIGRADAAFLAEEAVENAFLRIIKHIEKLNTSDFDRLRAYVLTLTRNEALRLLKREASAPVSADGILTDLAAEDGDFLQSLALREDYDRVVRAIKALDDKYRIPMFLHFVEELSPQEVAKQLDLPVKTVYTHLRRGKEMILAFCKKEGITYEG